MKLLLKSFRASYSFPKQARKNIESQLRWVTALPLAGLLALSLSASPRAAQAQAAPGVSFTVIDNFNYPDEVYAIGALVLGSDGDFYGTTNQGGVNFNGVVFKVTPSGTLTTIYNFSAKDSNGDNSDGVGPSGNLLLASDGEFYGVTGSGGVNGNGTIFKITPSGTLTTLHSFTGQDSSNHNSDGFTAIVPLAVGRDGDFYGTTASGGANGNGTIFKMTATGAFTTLYTFSGVDGNYHNTDGAQPSGALILCGDGNFYGTASRGGSNGSGTIFKLTPSGALTTLHTFSGIDGNYRNSDGAVPDGTLALGSDGDFYGVTIGGGVNGAGTIFKITHSGILTSLHSFTGTDSNHDNLDGIDPNAPLILGSDGNFYGTASHGGANNQGTIFKIKPSGSFTTLYTFSAMQSNGDNSDGALPFATLVLGNDGYLYGTAAGGGATNFGTIFKVTTAALAFASRFDFNSDGHADLLWYNTSSGGVSVWDMNDQSVLQYGATFTQLAPSSGWTPVAAPDVNGDGSPDLMWWNNLTGEMSIWTLSNTTVTSYGADFGKIADTHWKPVAVADNSGSSWSLVFQNTATGDISRWLMNGTTVTSYGGTIASLGTKTPYRIVGAPDLDGDGHSDLLFWNNKTGGVSYWSMDLANSKVLAYHGSFAQVSDTSWHLVGSEDTNGDGHPDLIWWNSASGAESRWLLNGTSVTQYGGTSTQVSDTTWQPTAIR